MESLNQIVICMGSSCFARGNRTNLGRIEQFLNDHGLRAQISLKGSRCENLCTEGPNIIINGQIYNRVDPGTLVDLLRQHFLPADKG